MAVRKFKPTTPGQRHKIIGTFEEITASVPEKSLVFGKLATGGRNNQGRMTARYIGGGHKKKFRIIDFKRNKDGVPATVKTIEYDPNRSARIALLFYADGEKRYIVAPNGLQVGAKLMSGPQCFFSTLHLSFAVQSFSLKSRDKTHPHNRKVQRTRTTPFLPRLQ